MPPPHMHMHSYPTLQKIFESLLTNPKLTGPRAIPGPLYGVSLGAAPLGTVGARHLGPPAAQTLKFWVG